jgi:hypothetical protein
MQAEAYSAVLYAWTKKNESGHKASVHLKVIHGCKISSLIHKKGLKTGRGMSSLPPVQGEGGACK